jgi:hypothetical protein
MIRLNSFGFQENGTRRRKKTFDYENEAGLIRNQEARFIAIVNEIKMYLKKKTGCEGVTVHLDKFQNSTCGFVWV